MVVEPVDRTTMGDSDDLGDAVVVSAVVNVHVSAVVNVNADDTSVLRYDHSRTSCCCCCCIDPHHSYHYYRY